MATEVLMPRQGQSVESCLIVEWKKSEGDTVRKGETLCEVETDKATFEVESPASGVLLRIVHQADDDVPVLTPIAYIGDAGEQPPAGEDAAGSAEADAHTEAAAPRSATAEPDPSAGGTRAEPGDAADPRTRAADQGARFISPRARTLARKHGLDHGDVSGSGPHGRIIERDIQALLDSAEPLTAGARAEAAAEPAMSLPREGSGIGGRVRTSDLRQQRTAAGEPAASATDDYPGPYETRPIKGVRKVIAERMLASLQTTAQLTLNSSADARALQHLRRRFKQTDDSLGLSGVTINDLVHFAVSRTLPRFGYMNSHMADGEIRQFSHVHLGFAVDTPRGLMVPTVRFADRLSLLQMSLEVGRLAGTCQQGSAGPEELAAATFTVTNLGSLGIEHFTPVLNPPQVAILGVSAIRLKPVEGDKGVEFVPSIALSLTIDHRAVDGAPAARFLQALSTAIAEIDLTLAL
ncbi:MAG: 2-oxo acid dehydrogenase subunit E2 [Spirochaetaceae bacterium]|nr:MAG: 2-oxo acid dehydrogenase subunit E2 [Spirochaetaceae bacterium]